MTRRYRKLSDWVYYFGVLPLLAILPARWGYALVRRQARHISRAQVDTRRLTMQNMSRIMGPDADPEALTRRCFEIMAADDLDGFYFPFLNSGNIDRYISFQGLEILEQVRNRGKGVVLFTAHLGSTCTAAVSLGLKGFRVFPLAHDSRSDPTLEHPVRAYSAFKLAWMKRKIGGKLIFIHLKRSLSALGEGTLEVYRLLQQGQIVSLPIDVSPALLQNTGRVRFLDRWCCFPTGIVRLAALLGSPIVPYFILRDDHHGHRQRLIVQEPIETTGDPSVDLQRCVDRLDALVREHPEHWFAWDSWSHFEAEQPQRTNQDRLLA